MLLARVSGVLVAAPKVGELDGLRFAVLRPLDARLAERGTELIAVDPVGAGQGQLVFTASAGSARAVGGLNDRPVDLAIVGIVDEIEAQPRGSRRRRSRGARR